jgi:2'-phosphotransferase
VDTDGLLTPITTEDIPEIAVHGTTHMAWPLILKSGGMRRMGRNHMHFAQGLPKGAKPVEPITNEDKKTAETEGDSETVQEPKAKAPVISGMRNTSTIFIYIDIAKALEAGIKFWKSDNGVILTEGDEKGLLGYQFFKRVEERQGGGKVLMRDGILPEGVEVGPNAADDELTIGRGKGKKRGGSGGARGGKGRSKAPLVDDSRDVWGGV